MFAGKLYIVLSVTHTFVKIVYFYGRPIDLEIYINLKARYKLYVFWHYGYKFN